MKGQTVKNIFYAKKEEGIKHLYVVRYELFILLSRATSHVSWYNLRVCERR